MKQQPISISANHRPAQTYPGLQWLLILLLGASLLIVSACDPGAGDGIDPGIIEVPVAFIKRPIPVDDMGQAIQADLRDPLLFSQGGDVYLRSNSTVNAALTNITFPVTGGMGDVKGLNASFDGKKLIFSLRLFDPDPNNDPTPTWNIYEYDIEKASLRRVIANFAIAEGGDDLFPAYLPDGRIVFTSTRQKQSGAVLGAEGKAGFSALDEDEDTIALVLHVMNPTGSNLHQISFNQSHDLHPLVLEKNNGGQIVFTRWDNAGGNDAMHLYKSNPDGSELEMIYGAHSHLTGTGATPIHFTSPREMQNGDLMVIARPFTGTFDGGDIYILDANRFSDIDKPIWSLAGLPGPGQRPATVNNVVTEGISVNGRYSSAFPLQDGSNRILVSKSICQVSVAGQLHPCIEPYLSAGVEASPAYSIWLYDMKNNTQKVVILAEQGKVITEAIAVQARIQPPVVFDKIPPELDADWITEKFGVVNIKSVYDMGNGIYNPCFFNVCTLPPSITSVQDLANPINLLDPADPAVPFAPPARFVRFVRGVGIPDPDDRFAQLGSQIRLLATAFGRRRDLGMRQVLGYAPIEPDGSVKVKVPANVPLALDILDSEGRRIGPRHQNWFQVQAGDTLTCNGCHVHPNGGPTAEIHTRTDGTAPSINSGLGAGSVFANTLMPGTVSPNPYYGTPGQTMAEVRFDRVVDAVFPPGSEPQLSPDLDFDDYWTDPSSVPWTVPAPYSYQYAQLDASIRNPAPPAQPLINSLCTPWEFNCRVTINYSQHIHPIWDLPRFVDRNVPPTPLDPLDDTEVTCVVCHTTLGRTVVAAGDLDLSDELNPVLTNFPRAYVELLFDDQAEELDSGGALVPIQTPVPDGMGGTILIDDPAFSINRRMNENGARRSYFMEKMTGQELDDPGRSITGTEDHSDMLTVHELKLISEWLDLGAQNFNDPFDPAAPRN